MNNKILYKIKLWWTRKKVINRMIKKGFDKDMALLFEINKEQTNATTKS